MAPKVVLTTLDYTAETSEFHVDVACPPLNASSFDYRTAPHLPRPICVHTRIVDRYRGAATGRQCLESEEGHRSSCRLQYVACGWQLGESGGLVSLSYGSSRPWVRQGFCSHQNQAALTRKVPGLRCSPSPSERDQARNIQL